MIYSKILSKTVSMQTLFGLEVVIQDTTKQDILFMIMKLDLEWCMSVYPWKLLVTSAFCNGVMWQVRYLKGAPGH